MHAYSIDLKPLLLSRYLVSIYSDTSVPYPYGTNSVVVQLELGDIVYVMAHPDYNNSLYGNSYGTFSGFLVKAGTCTILNNSSHAEVILSSASLQLLRMFLHLHFKRIHIRDIENRMA